MPKNKERTGDSQPHRILYLTDLRSSQQNESKKRIAEAIRRTKIQMMGRTFKVRHEPPTYCKRIPIAAIEYSGEEIVKITLSRIACKSWTCPRCNKVKALKVKYLLRETAIINNLGYFLTLTLDPKKVPTGILSDKQNNTHKYITTLFNTFITDLKRNTLSNVKLKYIWVLEFQKNGNAHLHILFNNFISINLIRRIWVRVGGGHIMYVEPAKTLEGISSYLSDYIVKGLKQDISEKSHFKFFEKRYSISQSCKRPEKDSYTLFNNQPLEDKLQILEDMGLKDVYNALIKADFGEQLIMFDKENKE